MRTLWDPRRLTVIDPSPHRFAAVAGVLYAASTLFVALHHEPWRDEADSWLVVRDAPLTTIIPHWTANAGTPGLWYVLLKPLIWLDLPYFSQTMFHLLIAWAAAAVLLLYAPLTRLTKVLLVSSYYFAFEYAVVARSYALTILLLLLAAALHSSRLHRRPLIYGLVVALLANANVHGAVISGALFGAFLWDRPYTRRGIGAAAVMAAGLLAAWLQLRAPIDPAYPELVRQLSAAAVSMAVGSAFLPGLPFQLTAPVGAAVLIGVAVSVRKSRTALLLLIGPLVALSFIYATIWMGGLRHAGLFLVLSIAAIWVARPAGESRWSQATALLLNLTLIGSAVTAAQTARAEVAHAFSGSREVAEFILRHRLEAWDIAAHGYYQTTAVLPYLPGTRFWYIGRGEWGSYGKWDRKGTESAGMTHQTAALVARKRFGPAGERWLLLTNAPLRNQEAAGYRLIFSNRRYVFRVTDERYWLYVPLAHPSR